jgi:subtilisin family serine protease
VDIYAPGTNVMSSINSTLGGFSNDSRNPAFTLAKRTGTSMSCPQVTGVMACMLEVWPRASQSQLLEHLNSYIKLGQMTTTSGGPSDFTDLQGSDNKFLFFFKERLENGMVSPKQNLGIRPSTGMMYPRPKIFKYGS